MGDPASRNARAIAPAVAAVAIARRDQLGERIRRIGEAVYGIVTRSGQPIHLQIRRRDLHRLGC